MGTGLLCPLGAAPARKRLYLINFVPVFELKHAF